MLSYIVKVKNSKRNTDIHSIDFFLTQEKVCSKESANQQIWISNENNYEYIICNKGDIIRSILEYTKKSKNYRFVNFIHYFGEVFGEDTQSTYHIYGLFTENSKETTLEDHKSYGKSWSHRDTMIANLKT